MYNITLRIILQGIAKQAYPGCAYHKTPVYRYSLDDETEKIIPQINKLCFAFCQIND